MVDLNNVLIVNMVLGPAACLSALSGFGFAIVSTPFLVLFFPAKMAVPLVLFSWMPLALLLLVDCYREIAVARMGPILAAGVVGVPLGAYGLAIIDDGQMGMAIGAMALLATIALVIKPGSPIKRERLASIFAGLVSGICGGASGMSGPPVVLFGLNQGWDHRSFRADLIGYFTLLHGLSLVLFRQFGLLDQQIIYLALSGFPGLLAGYFLGMRGRKAMSQQRFRQLALGLVALGGVLAFFRS